MRSVRGEFLLWCRSGLKGIYPARRFPDGDYFTHVGQNAGAEKENLASLARHQASMVLFLSAGLLEGTQQELLKGGYPPDTLAAIVYKATWPDEQVHHCTVSTLAQTAKEQGISNLALILVGNFLGEGYERSRLYDPSFSTAYRKAETP